MQRREFIKWVGVGAIASHLPIALAACTENNPASNVSNSELLSLGTVEKLDSKGFLLDEEAKIMVIKNSQGQIAAVDATCTHKGCIVDWKKNAGEFVCPCHDAKFAADGKVLAEPALEPLATYKVIAKDNEILVEKV